MTGVAIGAFVAGLAASSSALQGEADAGVIPDLARGRITSVSPTGFAWRDGIRAGQVVVALAPADTPGGWRLETRDGERHFVSEAARADAGLRASLPLGLLALTAGGPGDSGYCGPDVNGSFRSQPLPSWPPRHHLACKATSFSRPSCWERQRWLLPPGLSDACPADDPRIWYSASRWWPDSACGPELDLAVGPDTTRSSQSGRRFRSGERLYSSSIEPCSLGWRGSRYI